MTCLLNEAKGKSKAKAKSDCKAKAKATPKVKAKANSSAKKRPASALEDKIVEADQSGPDPEAKELGAEDEQIDGEPLADEDDQQDAPKPENGGSKKKPAAAPSADAEEGQILA